MKTNASIDVNNKEIKNTSLLIKSKNIFELVNCSKTFKVSFNTSKKKINKVCIINNANGRFSADSKINIVVGDSGEGKSVLLDVFSGLTDFNEGQYFIDGKEQNISIRTQTFLNHNTTEKTLHVKSSEDFFTNYYSSTSSFIINFLVKSILIHGEELNDKKLSHKIQSIKKFSLSILKEIFPLKYENIWNQNFNTLSRGQKSCVFVLMSICVSHFIGLDRLLFDEVFSGISESKFKFLWSKFKKYILKNPKVKNFFICTHNQELIQEIFNFAINYNIKRTFSIIANKTMIQVELENLIFSYRYTFYVFKKEEENFCNNMINSLNSLFPDSDLELKIINSVNEIKNINSNICYIMDNHNNQNEELTSRRNNIDMTIVFFGVKKVLSKINLLILKQFNTELPTKSIDYILTYNYFNKKQ